MSSTVSFLWSVNSYPVSPTSMHKTANTEHLSCHIESRKQDFKWPFFPSPLYSTGRSVWFLCCNAWEGCGWRNKLWHAPEDTELCAGPCMQPRARGTLYSTMSWGCACVRLRPAHTLVDVSIFSVWSNCRRLFLISQAFSFQSTDVVCLLARTAKIKETVYAKLARVKADHQGPWQRWLCISGWFNWWHS